MIRSNKRGFVLFLISALAFALMLGIGSSAHAAVSPSAQQSGLPNANTRNNNYYVTTTGSDTMGNGTFWNPWQTLAYAASQVPAGKNDTINLAPGTYYETVATVLPLGVNIKGAGQDSTIITSNGPIPAPGVDQTSPDWKLWYNGSLIQLVSPGYAGSSSPTYGSPDQMIPSVNGNQTLSGFTIDGNNKQIKAGVWVENRNNVTMHHVTFRNLQMRGAVFGRSDMWWFVALPDGMWMYNTAIHDCVFINSGSQVPGETLGNLNIAGLDGANIYNLSISDNVGYGIKFIFVGHYRNVKIHDVNISVSESDPTWGEKISIEMWNFSYGNEIYNINCNTWLSFVNHPQITSYEPTGSETNNLKVHNVRMIDQDGVNGNEAIEASVSGMEIYNNYIQDKGFGIAIWRGPSYVIKNFSIHNNIIVNVNRTPTFGFGQSAAVFIPDPATNVNIYNNVFDNTGNTLTLNGATGVNVENNVFLNTQGIDVQNGTNVTFNNNLKYSSDPTKAAWNLTGGPTLGTGNLLGDPGFKDKGNRWGTYYQPASAKSLVVDKGTYVGLPYEGPAPDIGRWEYYPHQ